MEKWSEQVVVIEKIYNFVVDYFFFIWNHLGLQSYVLKLMILTFIFFLISQITLDGKTIKSKVVDLDEI